MVHCVRHVCSLYLSTLMWLLFYCLLAGGAMHAMYCYSPLSDSWSLVTRLGERASCAIAACNNKLFITGGRDNKNQVISTVMCWDVAREVLTEECVLPMGVSHHGSVTLMKSYTHIHRITPASESQWQRLLWTGHYSSWENGWEVMPESDELYLHSFLCSFYSFKY